mmetsp:Transcript_9067/g.12150  ORF Transcript_9067/g.12150 Transcript_9067/m.12150 type:complete len:377 (+) Transcript_9067:191-1321(+)|eukprot:CAMPEP_0201488858 /NCGR_PEP_ID=MMETSP0151_2-20130828/19888_1 /ASSEMBLY_ACC=CAM_ASM_000257 /TAXON_ID=200890 /ORGANISM="Paramoeba atlantica, Strain 621/1 / CCAP 1560/9" /LENGTH=376 /DNA_ID=CAMNT_0047874247 /DNA_START=200 /DNA_END=1330 /DNA_ORIENTATION=-
MGKTTIFIWSVLATYLVPHCGREGIRDLFQETLNVEIDCCALDGIIFLSFFAIFSLVSTIVSSIKIGEFEKRAVLITGCDSGFGRGISVRLYNKGFIVFAACLTAKGVEELSAQCPDKKRMNAFMMNVTEDQSVEDGLKFVRERVDKERGLWALINNAGVLRGADLELCSMEDWKLSLDVNVLGIARVTTAFFPLLRTSSVSSVSLFGEEAGRVINVASVAGRFALPKGACYYASKFAVEGLSDCWRREFPAWNCRMVIIEPGVMKTELFDRPFSKDVLEERFLKMSPEHQELFGREYLENSQEAFRQLVLKVGGDPQLIVDGMEQAVSLRWPSTRMMIGHDTGVWIFLAYLPTFLSDFLISKTVQYLPKGSPLNK